MPSHNHCLYNTNSGGGVLTTYTVAAAEKKGFPNNIFTNTAGKSLPHNNLQPYITCYMWKRIA